MSPAERLVDTAQIVSEFGTSKPRISEWSNDPDSDFPAVAHAEGRKRFWRHDEVAAFFAKRAPKKRTLPAAVLEADQDELLTKREVAKLLGYTRTSTIDAYFRDRPGYFPEPDENVDGPMWRRGTIVAWASNRPGKGRRSSTPAAALPPVPVDGDPDELLGTAEVASVFGYGSVASFSSA
ncbi:helix-turn-helix transcriptional regulator, partial [Streptomyces mirabilis]